MTDVVPSIEEWRDIRRTLRDDGARVGFVPTMGALHAGHLSLMSRSLTENDVTVVSIFVNPTQFNEPADLEIYPRTLAADLRLLEAAGVDYLFAPDDATIYPDHYRYQVTERDVSNRLCGASRPGHFTGVLTVVMRMFNVIAPDTAYFGEKDFQQYTLILGMANAFHIDVSIRACPIVREPDGLAMSSRNVRLTPAGRILAAEFATTLRTGTSDATVRQELERRSIEIDYVETVDGRRFGAVYIDGVRLIDNHAVSPSVHDGPETVAAL